MLNMITILEKVAFLLLLLSVAIISVTGLTKLVPILRIYYDYPAQLSFMNVYAKRSLVPGAVIIDGMVST